MNPQTTCLVLAPARTCAPGRILGHEGVGIVEAMGAGVAAFHPGDHVPISCIKVIIEA